jgi:hypothetical protein
MPAFPNFAPMLMWSLADCDGLPDEVDDRDEAAMPDVSEMPADPDGEQPRSASAIVRAAA